MNEIAVAVLIKFIKTNVKIITKIMIFMCYKMFVYIFLKFLNIIPIYKIVINSFIFILIK